MPGSMTPNSKSNCRMLKKAASVVLASFRPSTYRKGTPQAFTRCGLADGLFEHPARLVSQCLLSNRVLGRCGSILLAGILRPLLRRVNRWC